MSSFLYHLFIRTYGFALNVAARFHPKARAWVEGRKNLLPTLERQLPPLIKNRPVAWFHAASLGEFEQGKPVIETFRSRFPDYFIFLTFFSPSGYEVGKKYAGADFIAYLPADTPVHARQLVALLRPRIAFFIKYEFWYNYLRELRRSGTIILSFSAIFRADQLFFKSYGSFYRSLLEYFDHIFVQNEESYNLLAKVGVHEVSLAGDTRFDRVVELVSKGVERPEIMNFVQDDPCLVIGSSWPADRLVLVPALNALNISLKVIIAPHEIHESELSAWEQTLIANTLRYSQYKSSGFTLQAHDPVQYLLIDNVGMLSSLYRYGHLAYIGGAFGKGLHNILEAATYGLPILFGNLNYQKFQEAIDLIRLRGAWSVEGTEEFRQKMEELVRDSVLRDKSGAICRTYVQSRTGATTLVVRCAADLLSRRVS